MKIAIRNRLGGIFAAIAVGVASLGLAPASATAAVPSAKTLPSEVYLYLSVPSVQELKARFNKTSLSKIQNDPAFADFIKQIESGLEQASKDFERETKMKLKDLLDIPTGEVALTVLKPPRGQVAAIAFVDFGESKKVVNDLLTKLEDAMEKENVDRKVQQAENTEIVVYTFPNENQRGPIKPQFAYFVKGSQFVVSNEISALESVLTRWDGKAPRTLADNRIYKHIMDKCKTGNDEPVFKWYLNPIESVKAGVMAAAEGNPQAAMVLGLMPLLGLNDFRGMGGTGDWAVNGYESVSKSLLYVDQPPQGLLNMFRFPATDLAPPKWVSAKTQTYLAGNWDMNAAYEAVETLVDTFQGAGALDRVIDDLADKPEGPGLHIKKDILDQLSGRFIMTSDGVENIGDEVPKMMFSIGVRDSKKAKDVIAKILKKDGGQTKTRNFRGETIVEFDAGQTTAGLSVVNNAIMISTNVSTLEQVIRGDRTQTPLAESATYRQLAKQFPAKTSFIVYQDIAGQIKLIYETARKGDFDNPEIKVDFTTLPPFEALEKYLPVSGGYTIPDENGVLSISFDQLKK